jgi:mannose-6-phosphate isomerase-like protein (cupin superfamily)
MPKVSKTTASRVQDFGVAEDRAEDLDGYTIGFTTIREGHDLAPMLASLPNGQCHCPHWGYVFSGRIVVTYGDREETYDAGDAFYMPPGHTPRAETGSEFVMFSPAEEFAATEAAIQAGLSG